jgi:hypothetical protein
MFIHSGILDIVVVGEVFICHKYDARYSDDALLHIVLIRRVSILFKMTLYTLPIRDVVRILVAFSTKHLPPSAVVSVVFER